ncbi:MAG TPA: secretin N-terminal domain-containing protein [Thermoanaerobaculia bacterium]|nr:secretin N-terminal domain-containing protein [Thermoanaerobaculia bacterium]
MASRRAALHRFRVAFGALLLVGVSHVAAAAASATPHPATPSVVVIRVFTLRYRRAEEVALLVRPLLTDEGSVILQPRLNTLTVRDAAGAVEKAAQAISSYDLPPRNVEISVTLLKASSEPKRPGPGGPIDRRPVSEVITGVGEQLKRRFNFTDYQRLDSVVVQGTEGDSVAYAIGGDYRLAFLVDPSGSESVIRLKDLSLERIRKDEKGTETHREILKTSINVQAGHTYICGIGRDESAAAALFVVFEPRFRGGPGIH